jgi:hypothetical protein
MCISNSDLLIEYWIEDLEMTDQFQFANQSDELLYSDGIFSDYPRNALGIKAWTMMIFMISVKAMVSPTGTKFCRSINL